jgi:hypothetical protein
MLTFGVVERTTFDGRRAPKFRPSPANQGRPVGRAMPLLPEVLSTRVAYADGSFIDICRRCLDSAKWD